MLKKSELKEKQLEEEIADLCHKQWSNWMKYLFSKCYDFKLGLLIIPEEYVKGLKKQINTEYKDLSEEEKESNRIEARKFIKLFKRKNIKRAVQ